MSPFDEHGPELMQCYDPARVPSTRGGVPSIRKSLEILPGGNGGCVGGHSLFWDAPAHSLEIVTSSIDQAGRASFLTVFLGGSSLWS